MSPFQAQTWPSGKLPFDCKKLSFFKPNKSEHILSSFKLWSNQINRWRINKTNKFKITISSYLTTPQCVTTVKTHQWLWRHCDVSHTSASTLGCYVEGQVWARDLKFMHKVCQIDTLMRRISDFFRSDFSILFLFVKAKMYRNPIWKVTALSYLGQIWPTLSQIWHPWSM